MYYVDKRINEVVKDLDISYLAPELYYEYADSQSQNIIIETWYDTNKNLYDYAYLIEEFRKFTFDVDKEREYHFKQNNFNPVGLYKYAVPTSWYKKTISTLQGE